MLSPQVAAGKLDSGAVRKQLEKVIGDLPSVGDARSKLLGLQIGDGGLSGSDTDESDTEAEDGWTPALGDYVSVRFSSKDVSL